MIKILVLCMSLAAFPGLYAQERKPQSIPIDNSNWVATDSYGRQVADFSVTGKTRKDKFVGVFYYIWHGSAKNIQFGTNITKYLSDHPGDLSGLKSMTYYWGEPEDGYYHSKDPWIIKKHLRLLANAGVDFLYFDCSNAILYLDVVEQICKVSMELRQAGMRTPQLVFLIHTAPVSTIKKLYDAFYAKGQYKDLWFYWQGKPLILASPAEAPDEEIKNFFTWRYSWAFRGIVRDEWPWINPGGYGWHSDSTHPEQMVASKGSHPTLNIGSSYNAGASGSIAGGHQPAVNAFYLCEQTGKGIFFEDQWKNILQKDPDIVMITQWNEWIAGCYRRDTSDKNQDQHFLGKKLRQHDPFFVDEFNAEYSRDIEPVKGGYEDVFYYQMVDNIRKFKGMTPPQPPSPPVSIKMDGKFGEWKNVMPVFKDNIGDVDHRDFTAYDGIHRYRNNTGRNDIAESRVARDRNNIYFYVKTRDPLTPYTGNNWMLLYIDADHDKATGWQGYDYLVNAVITDPTHTTLMKWTNGEWKKTATLDLRIGSKEIEIRVPKHVVMPGNTPLNINFHWADNIQDTKDITEFFSNGDSAPERRFDYHYSIN